MEDRATWEVVRCCRTLLKPAAKKEGWSERARMKPRWLPLRNRRTAKPSPEVSATLWAFRTSIPATCNALEIDRENTQRHIIAPATPVAAVSWPRCQICTPDCKLNRCG